MTNSKLRSLTRDLNTQPRISATGKTKSKTIKRSLIRREYGLKKPTVIRKKSYPLRLVLRFKIQDRSAKKMAANGGPRSESVKITKKISTPAKCRLVTSRIRFTCIQEVGTGRSQATNSEQ